MKKKLFLFGFLLVSLSSLGITSAFASEIETTEEGPSSSTEISPFAGMKPTTVYIVYFTGNSAPATIFYQTTGYGASYRGYLTRNYSYPIIWGTGSNYTNYYGTLYRSDLPLPMPASITIPENREMPVSVQSRATSKVINYTVTIRKGAYIPDYYWIEPSLE